MTRNESELFKLNLLKQFNAGKLAYPDFIYSTNLVKRLSGKYLFQNSELNLYFEIVKNNRDKAVSIVFYDDGKRPKDTNACLDISDFDKLESISKLVERVEITDNDVILTVDQYVLWEEDNGLHEWEKTEDFDLYLKLSECTPKKDNEFLEDIEMYLNEEQHVFINYIPTYAEISNIRKVRTGSVFDTNYKDCIVSSFIQSGDGNSISAFKKIVNTILNGYYNGRLPGLVDKTDPNYVYPF